MSPGVGAEHVGGGSGVDSHLRHDHAGGLMEGVVFGWLVWRGGLLAERADHE